MRGGRDVLYLPRGDVRGQKQANSVSKDISKKAATKKGGRCLEAPLREGEETALVEVREGKDLSPPSPTGKPLGKETTNVTTRGGGWRVFYYIAGEGHTHR